MNLAAWVAIYLTLVLLSIGSGMYWGFGVGRWIAGHVDKTPRHDKAHMFVDQGIDVDELDRPTRGTGEL